MLCHVFWSQVEYKIVFYSCYLKKGEPSLVYAGKDGVLVIIHFPLVESKCLCIPHHRLGALTFCSFKRCFLVTNTSMTVTLDS